MSNDAHGRSTGSPIVLTEIGVAAPSHAERARTLVASQRTGTLATLALDPAGYPYASFLTFALAEGEPVFLISRIAEHTRNLVADPRASLLVHEAGKEDPLANGRVTLLGRTEKLPRGTSVARESFLAAHPQAGYYVDFADFDLWRLSVESVRYIGGYGRMSWVDAAAFRVAEPDPLGASAQSILDHMNRDHTAALLLYSRVFTRAKDPGHAVMTEIDRYGFEMTITTPEGPGPARIAFERPIATPEEARNALVALLRSAEASVASRS